MDPNLRLDELGERRIIEEILTPRFSVNGVPYFGNDCALVSKTDSISDGILFATTDPCPQPMASLLGFEDYYYWGWLLATLNLSDLAAAGAKPLGLLTSLILPSNIKIYQLESLLNGIDDCCEKCGTRVIGGNLKEAPEINLSATAIGFCEKEYFFSRFGCKTGDIVIVIGDLGLFWSGVLAIKNQIDLKKKMEQSLLRNILTPLAKVDIGQCIAKNQLLTACLDNSDGLYPSLIQLAEANGVQILLNFEKVTFSQEVLTVCSELKVDPIRLSAGWGDWQLIACTRSDNMAKLNSVAKRFNVPIHIVGKVLPGEGVFLEHENHIGEFFHLDSQRFTKDSWFTAGLESYIDDMLNEPLQMS